MSVLSAVRTRLYHSFFKALVVSLGMSAVPLQADTLWSPISGTTWQYQLDGDVDTSISAEVYDIDLTSSAETVSALQAQGKKVVCYFSVATNETYRKDSALFPSAVQGEIYDKWSDEKWLDIKQIDILKPIMLARMNECQAKGFDGVEFDNIDIYNYQTIEEGEVIRIGTNFSIKPEDSINYLRWLAKEAHSRGLAVGLKNSPEILADVIDFVDFMVIEDCYAENWCHKAALPLSQNKPVFMVDYTDNQFDFDQMCETALLYGYSAILRDRGLTTKTFDTCPLSRSPVKDFYHDIVADGLIDDWTGVNIAYADVVGDALEADADYKNLKVTHDEENIYLLLSFDAPIDWMSSPYNHIFLDTDNRADTGYGLFHMGSEMQISVGGAFSQKNGDWQEGEMEGGTLLVVPSLDQRHWEVVIPKNLKHPDGSSWLESDIVNIVLESQDVNWDAYELAPDNAWVRFIIQDIPVQQRSVPDVLIDERQLIASDGQGVDKLQNNNNYVANSASSNGSGGGSSNGLLFTILGSLLILLAIRRLNK